MRIAVDTEGTGLDIKHGCRPFYVSTCDEEGSLRCWEWDVDPMTRDPIIPPKEIRQLRDYVLSYDEIIFHNAKYDVRSLESVGVWDGLDPAFWTRVHDTTVMHHCLASAEPRGLKELSVIYLDVNDDDEYILKDAVEEARKIAKKMGWRIAAKGDPHFPAQLRAPNGGWRMMDYWVPRAVAKRKGYKVSHPWYTVLAEYGTQDAERTMGLYLVLSHALEEEGLEDQYKLRQRQLYPYYKMEHEGVSYSTVRMRRKVTKFDKRRKQLAQRLVKRGDGIVKNVDAPAQISKLIFNEWGFKPHKQNKEGPSSDKDSLKKVLDEAVIKLGVDHVRTRYIEEILEYRAINTSLKYAKGYELAAIAIGYNKFRKLCPSFNPVGTKETRSACSNPNAQNISKLSLTNMREMFGPRPGRIWYTIDYENIELRIFAYASGDKELIQLYEEGHSVHLIMCQILYPREYAKCERDGVPFKERYADTYYQWVKNGDFALIYGASPAKADATFRVDGAYDKIRKRLPLIDDFMRSKFAEGRRTGYVETLGGYRLQVPKGKPHVAVNYFVQGSAGLVMNYALPELVEYLDQFPGNYCVIMQIHDEFVFDFPKHMRNPRVIREVKRIMENAGNYIGVPTPVEVKKVVKTWDVGQKVMTPM